jgi:hypothetical protein
MKVLINRNSGKAPRPLAEAIIEGREFPFKVDLTHSNILPLVIPSSGLPAALKPGETYVVKIQSFHQAWHLVTDLSEFATRTNNENEEYAVITEAGAAALPAPVVTPTAEVADPAPVETPAVADATATSEPAKPKSPVAKEKK